MKNFIYPLVITLLLLAGCLRENVETPRTFRATVESDGLTRTVLDEGNQVLWSGGEVISLFEMNQFCGAYEAVSITDGGRYAEFSKTSIAVPGASIDADVAFYPYGSQLECASSAEGEYEISGVVLPAEQAYAAGTFASGVFPMAAVADDGDDVLYFKNLCGVLKLQLVGNVSVSSIVLCGNSGEILSGDASVTVSKTAAPVVQMSEEGSTEVKLRCSGAGVALDPETPVSFFISLPPTVFEKGFTVTVADTAGEKHLITTSKTNTVRRSAVLKMPLVTVEASEEPDPDDPVDPDPIPEVTFIKTLGKSFKDVTIRVEVADAVQYSGGCVLKEAFNVSSVLRAANWKTAPRITDSFIYEGPMTAFPAGGEPTQVIPGMTYVVWLAPYAEGVNMVKEEDLVYAEITVPSLSAGGALEAVVSEFRSDFKSAEADVVSENASMIYAALFKADKVASLSTDEERTAYLFENSVPASGASATASISGMEPGEQLTLFAVAVDENGMYGPLLNEAYEVDEPVFNDDISLTVEVIIQGRSAKLKLSANIDDVVRYYYFVGKTTSSAWTKTLGGSRVYAEEYIAVNNDSYIVENTDDAPLTDGCIIVGDVEMSTEYVSVVMAVNSAGQLSRAFMTKFTPQLDLGDFVYRTGTSASLWRASRPTITFGDCRTDSEFYTVNWAVTPAEGMTAYAVCTHPNSMEGYSTPEALATRVYNMGKEVVPGQMETLLYGDKGNMVYVTWCDSDGNFYEVDYVSVPQN